VRHPVKLYISFCAFILFIAMTMAGAFWFASQTPATSAAGSVEQALVVADTYAAQMKAFFADFEKAGDKVSFLKERRKFLFEIRVPEEYLDRHIRIVSAVEQCIASGQCKALSNL
jgi:hypothetical protein